MTQLRPNTVDGVRAEMIEDVDHPLADPLKPFRKRHIREGFYHAIIDSRESAAVRVDYSVTEQCIPGIDSQNAQSNLSYFNLKSLYHETRRHVKQDALA